MESHGRDPRDWHQLRKFVLYVAPLIFPVSQMSRAPAHLLQAPARSTCECGVCSVTEEGQV